MKICMVGLGSIGRRHLRNLSALLSERENNFEIDALRMRGNALPPEEKMLLHNVYCDEFALPDDYDVAFICNPTAFHYSTIKSMAQKARHLFIEKPVFDHCGYNIEDLDLRPNGVYYVACPLRYTSVVRYLKSFVNENQIYAVRTICSTYLPNWRPGTDYRDTYSAHKEQGGGVSIDLIHEWDYLCHLFGLPEQVLHMQGTYSDLQLESDDISLYIARYSDKLVSLSLDYFGRSERREVELYTADDVIVGDLRKQQARFLRSGQIIDLSESRDAYQMRELEAFLDMISGKLSNTNSVFHAAEVLKIAKGEYQK